jgi:PKD repeat protein/flagellar hook assembly protein FlgD/lysophospholipase L1-like esterase
MRRRSVRRYRVLVGGFTAMAVLAGLQTPVYGAAPTIHLQSPERSFSPNGDGFEDRLAATYRLDEAANLTATVLDGAEAPVRVLAQSQSTSSGYHTVTWDGFDAEGRRAPEGRYLLRLVVSNSSGSDQADLATAIDVRPIATIEAPTPGAQLSGTAEVVVAPASDVTLSSAQARSSGCSGDIGYPGADGKVRSALDTTGCSAGEQTLTADVSWTDVFGQAHQQPHTVPVTVLDQDAPTLAISVGNPVATRSDSSGSVTGASGYVTCDDASGVAAVLVEVRTSTGELHKTLLDQQGGCPWYGSYWSWSGDADPGVGVPDGPLERVLHVRVEDAEGQVTEQTAPVYADLRVPGSITEPSASPTVTMTAESPLRAAAAEGAVVHAVTFGLGSCTWSGTAASGAFTATVDATACGVAGRQDLRGVLEWETAFGQVRTYTAAVPVDVPDTQAPLVDLTHAGPIVLSAPGVTEAGYLEGYCSDNTELPALAVTVDAADGTVLRTLEAECSHWGYFSLVWDGLGDDGQPLADGTYRAQVTATDATGLTASDELPVTVDRRVPGTHVAPEAGTTLPATVELAATAAPGTDLHQVTFSLPGCSAQVEEADVDGRWTAMLDTAGCAAGEHDLRTAFVWQDAEGNSHTYTVATPVIVVDTTAPSLTPGQEAQLVALSAPGQPETHSDYAYCSDNTGVTALDVTVLNSAGDALRVLPLDGQSCSYPGYAYFSWDLLDSAGDAVPDGSYATVVRASDAAGNVSTARSRVEVRRVAPGALTDPQADATLAGAAPVVFLPATPTATITGVWLGLRDRGYGIYNASDDGRWRTTIPVGDYEAGPATLGWTVSWSDDFGGSHYFTGDSREVTVEPDAVPLAASVDVARGTAPLDVGLTVETSDGRSRPVELVIDWGDGGSTETVVSTSPYAPVLRSHRYESPGTRSVVVTASNGVGGYASTTVPVVVEGPPNQPPTLEAAVTPLRGTAPHEVTVSLDAVDPDSTALTYKVDFGDGSPALTGAMPHGDLTHTYTRPGTYFVRSSVSDGALTAARTSSVSVVLPEPLTAEAGDSQQVVVDQQVVLDGGDSRPHDLIDSWAWDLGDGTTATQPRVEHVYTEPGTYTAQLTVTIGTETASDTATVTVLPPPRTPGLDVLVTSASDQPLAEAQVLVIRPDGTKVSATTNGEGHALLQGLPDGPTTFYAIAPGHKPKAAQATVTDGSGDATVALESGEVGAATLEATRLTAEQAAARGIDANDESNFHIYEAKIHLIFVHDGVSTTYTPRVTVSKHGVRCEENCEVTPGGGGWAGCTRYDAAGFCTSLSGGGYDFYPSVSYIEKEPVVNWLVIPVRARFAKELFDVKMIVQNLTEGFDFDPGTAQLTLPEGLSLAALTTPQSTRVDVPAVPGGKSHTISWVVRGDTEGSYQVSAAYTSLVMPFEQPVRLEARTAEPFKIWAGSALRMEIEAEDRVSALHPYRVRVGLHNLADVPVYNASVEYLIEGKVNYIYQPREQLLAETAVIQPGETFWNDAILVPQIFGRLDLTQSFVKKTGGTVDLTSRIVSVPRHGPFTEDPTVEAFPMKDAVGLVWERVPGATSYEIFTTPDLDADFPAEPVITVPGSADRALATLPAGTEGWFAIRTVTDGHGRMEHPAVLGDSRHFTTQPVSDVELSARYSCGRDIGATVDFTSVFASLTHYRVLLGDQVLVDTTALTPTVSSTDDSVAQASFSVSLSQLGDRDQRKVLSVLARDTSGEWGPPWSATVSSACPDYTIAVVGDSIAWGQGLDDDDKYPSLVAAEIERLTHRKVEVKTLARSGATLTSKVDGCPTTSGEVPNQGEPAIISCQIEKQLRATDADLVLLDGCINDVGVLTILFGVNESLEVVDVGQATRDKCGEQLPLALDAVHRQLPDAKVVLTGYYQIASALSAATLAAKLCPKSGPYAVKCFALGGALFGYAAANSEEFDETFRGIATSAVEGRSDWAAFADPRYGAQDAAYVPFTSRLWQHDNDDKRIERRAQCATEKPGDPICLIAGIGHPNVKGALKYYEAIRALPSFEAWTTTTEASYSSSGGEPVAVAAGDSVGTGSTAGADAASGTPELTITTPVAGAISVARQEPAGSTGGFSLVGQELVVSAPEATAEDPLVFAFRADLADLHGRDPQTLTVLRNGVAVPDCSGTAGQAAPDPCVQSRQTSGSDVVLRVLTSRASTWQLVVAADGGSQPEPTPTAPAESTGGGSGGGTGGSTGGESGGGTGGSTGGTGGADASPTPNPSATPAPGALPAASPDAGASPTPGADATPASSATPAPGGSPEAGTGGDVNIDGLYHPLVPTRIYDSRQTGGIVVAGRDRVVQVLGQAGVPTSGVGAVVVNLTSAGTTAATDVQVYPTGARPAVRTSNLNPRPGAAVAALVTTAVGSDGTISLSTAAGSAHLVLDVVGWYGDGSAAAGSRFHPVVPSRITDTRSDRQPVAAGADREVVVTGAGGVPATGVEAVVVNLTSTGSTAGTDLQLYPAGAAPQVRTSNLNVGRSQTRANLAVVKVGRHGRIGVSTAAGQTHVVLDVVGWYGDGGTAEPGLRFVPSAPVRAYDTRDAHRPLLVAEDRVVELAGHHGIPVEARAVVGSLTVVGATRVADLQAFPTGQRPERRTSNVNVANGLPVPNLAVLGLGSGGSASLSLSAGAAHVIVDAAGWFVE